MEETRQRDKDPARYMIWVVYMCIPTGSYYGDYKQVRFAIIMTPGVAHTGPGIGHDFDLIR